MDLRKFSLRPFGGAGSGPALGITGSIGRRARLLTLRYELRGDLRELAVPAPDGPPLRKDRLWEETCLEFFLGAAGSDGYWEFNISPAGHWNVYRFGSYREGMREEPAFGSLPFRVQAESALLALALDLEIGEIVPAEMTVEVGVCAVVRSAAGGTTHWALRHPGPRPDFHRRDAFGLVLPTSP